MGLTATRLARPTVDLRRIRTFYEHVVGMTVLGDFADHDGFDGVIFGLFGGRTQLELVHSPHHDVPSPSAEDALVLYHDSVDAAAELTARLRAGGAHEVAADDATLNPYWPRTGSTVFVDPDGYRLIVSVDHDIGPEMP